MKVDLLAITPDADKLIETAGRIAYLSFDKQGKDSDKAFIRMLVKNQHVSVLEHASATFRIFGVSRACTHQLVRHRLCSFTQQSQRYVDEKSFNYIEPESIRGNPEAHRLFTGFINETKRVYASLQKLGAKKEDARFVLPNAVEAQIVVTANLREWRHIIELRCRPKAQWEIRELALEILRILKKQVPLAFEDLEIDNTKRIVTKPVQSPTD
jgi:thymidylate synthase (FAD)